MPVCVRPVSYMPRQTHECDAAVLVRRHLAEFLDRCEERAGPLPEFVKGELEGFAGCGDLELGAASGDFTGSVQPCKAVPPRAVSPSRERPRAGGRSVTAPRRSELRPARRVSPGALAAGWPDVMPKLREP